MLTKSIVLVSVLLSLFGTVSAKEFVVSYDGFFDRLKVLEKGNFEFARVNFYVVDIATLAPCQIAKGEIITENSSAPLTFTPDAQLLLPYDKQLDKDKAIVVIEPKNPKHDCQLKFQIEAEHFSVENLNTADLYQLHIEFDELLSDLSGFFVSKLMGFLLPEQKGVKVVFNAPINFVNEQIQCSENICTFEVSESWQAQNETLLSHHANIQIEQVTPWIEK
ncbi:hypothetical protein PSECIP111951_01749 [Pseudoalteromonas holothuriae]|uniref:DUF2987 domain-containing protein n=1 Tax=Pseudoalteromonas holothuriae TaxID=2963714 RepID=A0A9W4VRZ8_9GAMM|nr:MULTISPECIES: DUF2987 domain-containing protein [unclassified Pseudoalteromonas]CAH9057836.1 hypothetical protein PSECIP111951_01749 [Pseudoalteromonas sp. CIP111951]CAH9058853.1 hypothetical protein PSECIP111854_02286 [Pseudoalteromonas sp. CIP111854]